MASPMPKDARACGPARADCLRPGGHDRARRSGIRGLSPVLTGWHSAGESAKRRAIRLRESQGGWICPRRDFRLFSSINNWEILDWRCSTSPGCA